jgi:ATP-dependent helicase/nuclease subunit A
MAISGQIDRLAIGPDTVTAVDFKSGRAAPHRPEAIPRLYLRQMAAYRALLASLYPSRIIRCGLVWTAGGEVTWLADEIIDRTAWQRSVAGDAP